MKKIFLSFSPEWYKYIQSGEKVYEHRKRFTNEEVIAFLYLGLPIQKIVAVIHLGKRILIENWLLEYKDDYEAVERIKHCMTRNKWAMEIKEVNFIEPISIQTILNEFPNFHIPQSFLYLDKKQEILDYLESHIKYTGEKIVHNFQNISSNIICKY